MGVFKKDYIAMAGKNADFYAVSIITTSGEEMFAYVNEVEEGVYLLNDPLKITRVMDDDGKPNIMFRRFNIFTEDKFTVLKEHSVTVMNHLSPAFVRAYERARGQIHEQDKEIEKIMSNVNKSDEDFYKDVIVGSRSLN